MKMEKKTKRSGMQRDIQEIKLILKELVGEVADLKERVIGLEAQLGVQQPRPARAEFVMSAESYGNIGKLYTEGYHICPVAFGQVRDEGECLFCVNLLEKK